MFNDLPMNGFRARIVAGVFLFAFAAASEAASVTVAPDCDGMGSVEWSETTLEDGNSRLTLRALPAAGKALAQWTVSEGDVVAWQGDLRCPGPLTVTVDPDAEIVATFVAGPDDGLAFDISDLFDGYVDGGENVSATLEVDSISFPTVTFKNLPPGLAYDVQTLTLSGTPTEPGRYEIEANAVNGNGYKFCGTATVRVGNVDGECVSGTDEEIAVGEYWYGEVSNMFYFAEEPTSISLSADVPGLEYRPEWQLLFGVPTTPGEYVIRTTATFPAGDVETATLTLTVTGPEPDDYDLDFGFMDGLQVGDALSGEDCLGSDTTDWTILCVTGLPTGLVAESREEGGVKGWYVSGTALEAGFFHVEVQLEDRTAETQCVVAVRQTVTVADVADVYLAATSEDASKGTVSGGGAASPVADVTLVAVPGDGFVFSGWHDETGERLVLTEGVDYRTAKVCLPAGTDFSFLAPVAHFTAVEEDVAPDLSEFIEFSFVPGEAFEQSFAVESPSLPTLTFEGLPNGMACAASGDGSFVLSYDPTVAKARSGRYPVTVTAVNGSGRTSTASFRITVETVSDDRIHILDDYGEFAPDEEIDPIDLTEAVDFARGESLRVSGLPRRLIYNKQDNKKKGIVAHTITGTPMVPGDYTLRFVARVVSSVTTNSEGKVRYRYEERTATAFLTVLPFPRIDFSLNDLDAEEAGCRVDGAGNYRAGTEVTLTAVPAEGWVFAGWDGLSGVSGLAALNPRVTYVTGSDDLEVLANFMPVSEDGISLEAPDLSENGFAAEWPLKAEIGATNRNLIVDLIQTASWPTVTVSGLPTGVRFSSSNLLLSGKPTKSGVYHVTVRARTAGGYSFVRVFDVAVLNADGSLPVENPLVNAAEIDFDPLKGLMTGVCCPSGEIVLGVGAKPETGAAVTRVSVSGLPAGLKASTSLVDDGAEIELAGTPSKAGRFVISVSVTYADRKSLKSQAAVVVEDGGSFYLYVTPSDGSAGTVSGEGVYASGATVRLSATPAENFVFSGWCTSIDEDAPLFEPLRDVDDIDPRRTSVAFPFRPSDFDGNVELIGSFVQSVDDAASVITLESDDWEIDPEEESSLSFAVDSLSAPSVSVTGLPKGVTVDAARGVLSYSPNAATVPGIYTAKISAKNATQVRATVMTFEIRVANRVSDVIGGLDPDMDAYPISVGVTLDPSLISPTVDEGWTLTAKGLPSGLSFKDGVVSGVPSRAGNYTVTFTATSGTGTSKVTETATVTLCVSALPETLSGTFTGVLTDGDEAVVGTVTVTTTAAGRISVAAKTAAKNVTFTAKSWESFAENIAKVGLLGKNDTRADLTVEVTDDWRSWQASGTVTFGEEVLSFAAQRNPYGTRGGFDEARSIAKEMSKAGATKIDGWTVRILASGNVSLAGKIDRRSISGSAVLQYGEDQYFARYVKFIDKKTIYAVTFFFNEDGTVETWSVED